MCGILGAADLRDLDVQRIGDALDAIDHRGPDARGIREFAAGDARCVLGHTRLRIIDLSPRADQPLPNEDETVWVVFNGEIYNHRELRHELIAAGHTLRSDSDTEVFVHLYEQCGGDMHAMLNRLRGMFAFALFDTVRGRLVVARDRLGIKPMYFIADGNRVAFASEVRALATAGFPNRRIDRGALAGYATWGVVPGPRAIIEDVRELAPGSYMDWQGGGLREHRWWRLPASPDQEGHQQTQQPLAEALRDSVARHLIADRPVGLFLSSGLDSTAVATLAAAQGPVRGLTVAFEGGSKGVVDEGSVAKETARNLGIDHVEVRVEGADAAKAFGQVVAGMDQPTSDGFNTWLVCRAAREAGLVVALSGVGGDELFGGYPSFREVPRLAIARNATSMFMPQSLRRVAAQRAAARNPGGRIARALSGGRGLGGAYRAYRGLFSDVEVAQMLHADPRHPGVVPPSPHRASDAITHLEMSWYLPNQLLRDADQMSMQHSLEVRVPLLDDAVVASALAIPAAKRLRPGKETLASAAGIEMRDKQPFTLPFIDWMRSSLSDVVAEGLLSESLPLANRIDAGFRRHLHESFLQGRTHWSRPWSIVVLRHWAAAHGYDC